VRLKREPSMDTARFDRLTRSLAIRVPRRQTFRLLSILAPLLGMTAMALAPDESAADNGRSNGNGKGGNGGSKGNGGKGNGKNKKNGGKKHGKKHHNKKDNENDDILVPLCAANQRPCSQTNRCVAGCLDNSYVFEESTCTCKCPPGKAECAVGCVAACPPFSFKVINFQTCVCECPAGTEECNGVCLPTCDLPHHRDPSNSCLCGCAAGQVECGGHCLPPCGPGLVLDPVSCTCVCQPSAAGRDGEDRALTGCCSTGVACGGQLCCEVGQICTTGSYQGQTRAGCCTPTPGILGPCDGVCCATNPALTMCCPGLSNPCRAIGAGC
jgi:hypothetical protein